MLSVYEITVEERDRIWPLLNEEQIRFLQESMTRGKRTIFARILATEKGASIPDDASFEEIERLLDDWVYLQYTDAGFISEELKCECGRSLRYRHTVQHKSTGEIMHFGITHLELHTGIDAGIVARIKSGFDAVDFELNEILCKFRDGWDFRQAAGWVPSTFLFPEDVKLHLQLGLPLLDRQLERLNKAIRLQLDPVRRRPARMAQNPVQMAQNATQTAQNSAQMGQNPAQIAPNLQQMAAVPQRPKTRPVKQAAEHQLVLDLFGDEPPAGAQGGSGPGVHGNGAGPFELDEALKAPALAYIQSGTQSARIVSELLIKHHGADAARFRSGKPELYVPLCVYLDSLVEDGSMKLLYWDESDRNYRAG